MKVAGRGKIIDEDHLNLQIEPDCARALGLQKGTMLSAVLLTPRGERPPRQQETPTEQWITIVASPLPTPSWGNLFRASFTVDPAPGSLRKILTRLNDLEIFCRHIESTNGIDFRLLDFYGADKDEKSRQLAKRVIPSTVMVLEVPPKVIQPEKASTSQIDLHAVLRRAITKEKSTEIMQAQNALGKALSPSEPPFVTIDWLSPMQTLNRLGHKKIVSHGQSMTARELRMKLPVQQNPEGRGYFVSAHPWRKLLGLFDEVFPAPQTVGHRRKVFALSHVDSDEKIITWNLFSSDKHFITQFELIIPADGLEQEWLAWAFERIDEAKGNIITGAMTSRLEGHWSICRLQVVFPIDESVTAGKSGDVKCIIDCFRELSGEIGRTAAFESFKGRLPDLQKCFSDAIGRDQRHQEETGKDPSCYLQNVIIWDLQHGQAATDSHVDRFARNPFSFTLPLNLEAYEILYSEPQWRERTRYRLANRIIDRLSGVPGENIAIVGAPRAGKTTIINLVHDLLARRAPNTEGSTLKLGDHVIIPVRVNAAIVPPIGLFIEVAEQIEAWVEKSGRERWAWLRDGLIAARRHLLSVNHLGFTVKGGFPGFGDFGVNVGRKTAPPDYLREYEKSSEALRAMVWSMQDISNAQARDFLRSSLEIFKRALTPPTPQDQAVRLAVLVDEVSTLSAWGHDEVMPIWRHVIESRDFLEIRWLISTSRPLEVATRYSPITNVFKEYSVGSLRVEEALRLLSALSESRDKEKLAPFATNRARTLLVEITSRLPYLMQVCCYHIYDRAIRYRVPIITNRLCINSIEEDILPEIADYLEHQWRQVPTQVQEIITNRLTVLPKSCSGFFRAYSDCRHEMPPQHRKVLRRLGLQGEDDLLLAPLVALWLVKAAGWED